MPEDNKLTPAHNYAFRSAYEFLQEMWPPVNSVEFFQVAAAKGNERFNSSNGNKLLQKLLVAVLSYMEDEITSNGGAAE